MNIEKLEEINKKINTKANDLVELIKQYNPYDIICNIFTFIRNFQVLTDDSDTLTEYDKIKTQFCIEILYGLITCVDKEQFKNNYFEEENIYIIMNECEELFKLKGNALTSIMIHKGINNKYQDYIFNDLIRLDITGKRYDFFEKEHHKNTLKTVFNYVEKKYHVNQQCLLNGIESLKTETIFGLNKAIEKIDKIINNNSIDDVNSISDELKKEALDAFSEMFGLENFDVIKITNWSKEFVNIFSTGVGKNSIDLDNIDFLKIIKLQNIINTKPIIFIEDKYYCIRLPRLLDNFDKILLKQLYKDYNEEKQKIIKSFSQNIEYYTKVIFSSIFEKKAKYYQNNYYKKDGNTIENDLIIELDDYLIIVEIKSGNFTPDLAYENVDSHIDTLNNLVSKAGTQISELEKALLEKGTLKIYDSNKKGAKIKTSLNKNKYKDIFKIAITFEGFNEIAARAEKIGIINLNLNIIVCSIDDLEVYGDFFKKQPVNFINFLKNRTISTKNILINLNDELDHLGLYLECANYSMYVSEIAKEYKKIGMMWFDDFRTPIDDYYRGKYFGDEVEKPKLPYPSFINKIVDYLNDNNTTHGLLIGNSIISLNGIDQKELDTYIENMINFNKATGRIKHLGIRIDYYLLMICCCVSVIKDEKQLIKEFYANLKLNECNEAYAVFIICDSNNDISNIKILRLTKSDYQYVNDIEIEILASTLKEKRNRTIRSKRKIGRNEPCYCGSGKKYKKCCGK